MSQAHHMTDKRYQFLAYPTSESLRWGHPDQSERPSVDSLAEAVAVASSGQLADFYDVSIFDTATRTIHWERVGGVVIDDKLEDGVVPSKPLFKAGDVVCFTNDYGVKWHGLRVAFIDKPDKWGNRYYVEPTDTPWMYTREANLSHEVLSLEALQAQLPHNGILRRHCEWHPGYLEAITAVIEASRARDAAQAGPAEQPARAAGASHSERAAAVATRHAPSLIWRLPVAPASNWDDTPGELGSALRNLVKAEQYVTTLLYDQPAGTAIVDTRGTAHFLWPASDDDSSRGQLVLWRVAYDPDTFPGNLPDSRARRYDDLAWVDIDPVDAHLTADALFEALAEPAFLHVGWAEIDAALGTAATVDRTAMLTPNAGGTEPLAAARDDVTPERGCQADGHSGTVAAGWPQPEAHDSNPAPGM